MKAVIPGRQPISGLPEIGHLECQSRLKPTLGAGEPGIYNHRPGVMDSGFSALRASPRNDSRYDSNFEIASLIKIK
jgi:hypothetical protein